MFTCQALCLQVLLVEGAHQEPAEFLHHLCKVILNGQHSLAQSVDLSTQRVSRGHILSQPGALCLKAMLAEGPGHSLWSLLVIHRP